MRNRRLLPLLMLFSGWLTSCSTRPVRLATPCAAVSASLTEAWKTLREAMETPGGCDSENGMHCEVLRARIERLSIDCPHHPQVIMANALLAYDARNFVRVQQLLDELFSYQIVYPEGAALRARIAMEQGNLPFALRYLPQEIRQNGDAYELRETYASALYLVGRWDEARRELAAAQNLGAPAWRVAYSIGLIEEATGRFEEAMQRYREALLTRPGWRQPESRMRALVATGKVAQ